MNTYTQRRALLYVPFMVFNPYHHVRDQGGTASGFVAEGFDTTMIIGDVIGTIPDTEYKIIKTHNTQPRSLTTHIREVLLFIKNFKEINPDIMLVWNVGIMPSIVSILVKLFELFGKKKLKILLRLDWDGTMEKENSLRNMVFLANLLLSNMLFDWTTIETKCGKKRVDELILRPNKLKVVPVGYHPSGKKSMRSNAKKEKYVLSVARIAQYKNIEGSLRAFSSVTEDFPEWRFVHVGMCQDSDYFRLLKELSVNLSIESKVIFAGELDYEGLDSWFSRCPIFITSSFKESFNLARLEAMVNGLIVISSGAGCPSDFPGIQTFLDTQSAVIQLRSAMREAEAADMTFHKKYENVFSWPEIVKLIQEL